MTNNHRKVRPALADQEPLVKSEIFPSYFHIVHEPIMTNDHPPFKTIFSPLFRKSSKTGSTVLENLWPLALFTIWDCDQLLIAAQAVKAN